MSSTLGVAHVYHTTGMQQRINVVLSIPIGQYDTQAEAMDHAYSVGSRTRHRMQVYPVRNEAALILGWRIKIGKGPLT